MKFIGQVDFTLEIVETKTNVYKSDFSQKMLRTLCLPCLVEHQENKHLYSTFKLFYIEESDAYSAMEKLVKLFSGYCGSNNLTCKSVKYNVEPERIMDSVSHDEKLIGYINYIWARNHYSFEPILTILYQRDQEEAEDKGVSAPTEDNFDEFAYEFLNRVCDNVDLKTIIDFIRYREDNRVLYSDGWVELF
jgi:hypothetical protein